MSEIVTKHPEVIIGALKSQGATCGTGAKPTTLTSCPPESLCTLDGVEVCVLGPGAECGNTESVVMIDPAPRDISANGTHVLGGAALAVVVVAGIWMAGRR